MCGCVWDRESVRTGATERERLYVSEGCNMYLHVVRGMSFISYMHTYVRIYLHTYVYANEHVKFKNRCLGAYGSVVHLKFRQPAHGHGGPIKPQLEHCVSLIREIKVCMCVHVHI